MSGSEAMPIIKKKKQEYDSESHIRIGHMESSFISTAYSEIMREISRNRSSDALMVLDRYIKRMDDAACDVVFKGRHSGHLYSVIRDVAVDTYDYLQKIVIEGR